MQARKTIKENSEHEVTSVLLVEDEVHARDATAQYLARRGFRVSAAASADEALQLASEDAPDVVVCDWRLGDGGDGAEVARELQSRYGVAIVFTTAHPLDELRSVTHDLRVERYLRKPISLLTLADTVELAGQD